MTHSTGHGSQMKNDIGIGLKGLISVSGGTS
jgi:hypothetical protein